MPGSNTRQPSAEQPTTIGPVLISRHLARFERACDKNKQAILAFRPLAYRKELGILTPASPDSLPPLGDLIADEPFWRYPIGKAREGVAHLRVWLTASPERSHLAVVTQTGSAASVTESAGQIWAELARRYGPSLVLLEHHPAPGAGEGAETLDLVRIGADGSPRWLAVWPTAEDNPRHAGLELWMAVHGHRIVDRPASWFDTCEHQEG